SCPKTIVDFIIDNVNCQPSQNKVWVLGGESINKSEIEELILKSNENVLVHCEDVYSNSDKCYLDPLYYIFNGEHNGLSKLIVLIQFKTKHMGVWTGDEERN